MRNSRRWKVSRLSLSQTSIRVANALPFGLGTSAWKTDKGEHEQYISGLDAGMVFISMTVSPSWIGASE
jgi:acyl-CoA reductase-like NAD-dependent aldehyde dehydrogenase